MRVITGKAKHRRLFSPEGLDTRPTPDRVKEAVFSMIQFEVEGARVLDLFAGSGQMGIEALSRGAHSCVLVDYSKKCRSVLLQNLAHTGLGANAHVLCTDADSFLKTTSSCFDIAFLDPPYQSQMFGRLLPLLAEKMSDHGVILCETDHKEAVPVQAGRFLLHRSHRYGKSKISVYRPQDTAAEPEE